MLALATLVAAALTRPDPPVFALTPLVPREPPRGRAGPDTVTLDARSGEHWVRVDLARRAIAGPGEPWDLAVRRHRMIVRGGVRRLDRPFAAVAEVPADGYQPNRVTPDGDTVNAVLDGWYDYGFFSHMLAPAPVTFVIRTVDGHHATLGVLGYYCEGPEAGCLTFQYVYQ